MADDYIGRAERCPPKMATAGSEAEGECTHARKLTGNRPIGGNNYVKCAGYRFRCCKSLILSEAQILSRRQIGKVPCTFP